MARLAQTPGVTERLTIQKTIISRGRLRQYESR